MLLTLGHWTTLSVGSGAHVDKERTVKRLFVLFALAPVALTAMATPVDCGYGVYGVKGKQVVVISNPTSTSANAPERYTFLDGRRGDVNAAGGPVRCEQGTVRVKGDDGAYAAWNKLPLIETPTRFKSHGTELAGVLIEPEDAKEKPPLVVFVHGSEKTPGIGGYYPYVFAAEGLSVFAYDKRGTGASDGDYTQNFELLGDDAAAALNEARRLAAGRYSRAGLFGGSQGGWVAPLAAKRAHADFVAVGFGIVVSPLEQDQEQVAVEMKNEKYGAAAIAEAQTVTAATSAVMASHFTSGFEQLATARQRFAAEPWFKQLKGQFTGDVLSDDEADLRRTGAPRFDNLNIIWNYDALTVIRSLSIPQLWVVAGDDSVAPGGLTRSRLGALQREGKPIDLYVFPHTDHGMYEFVEDADGTRHNTRIADGYFSLLADWMRQRPASTYGRGERIH